MIQEKIFIFYLLTISIPICICYTSFSSAYSYSTTQFLHCGITGQFYQYQHWVSLNIQNKPKDYTTQLTRPILDQLKLGMYKNGDNCGRFIRVTLKKYCQGGINSGVPGQTLCSGGTWVTDAYTNAYQDFLVVAGCISENQFCRDDVNHVRISQNSLSQFILNGKTVDVSQKWNNRDVTWEFISGPTEPFKIYWKEGAQRQWALIIIVGIEGIKQVEQLSSQDQLWYTASRFSDQGLTWVLPIEENDTYQIRITDQKSTIYPQVNPGQGYRFKFPNSCVDQLCKVITEVQMIP